MNANESLNVAYWEAWFQWASQVAIALAKKGDFLGLTAYFAELGDVVGLLIAPVESLANCFHGSWFAIAGRVLSWARSNPDPLADFRKAAAAFKAKWSKSL
jgi:hypothetical protein